jgi:hypothetical protein
MKQILTGILVFSLATSTSPLGLLQFSPAADAAFAGRLGQDRGFTGRPAAKPGGGARTRPSRPAAPVARPSVQPPKAQVPAARPSVPQARPAQPQVRPAQPQARPSVPQAKPAQTPSRPQAGLPGSGTPQVRPAPGRPEGARPELPNRPQAGARPADRRPPGTRPPGQRPPGQGKPPGWHPPHHRPPNWRPPYHRPPYHRPPHYHWGHYHWHPTWGWFFTAVIVGSTLAFVADIDDDGCERIQDSGETLYLCDGVLYRSTYYQDERVYEIVSDPPDAPVAAPVSVIGLAVTDPLTQGDLVRDLQNRLIGAGYDVGTVDGIYGTSSRAAVEWFQYDNALEVTGVVDAETAKLLGF